jgi:hypothetical protein
MTALSLAGGRVVEITREPSGWVRIALFHRYGTDRMQEGGFCCAREELPLLAMTLERLARDGGADLAAPLGKWWKGESGD